MIFIYIWDASLKGLSLDLDVKIKILFTRFFDLAWRQLPIRIRKDIARFAHI